MHIGYPLAGLVGVAPLASKFKCMYYSNNHIELEHIIVHLLCNPLVNSSPRSLSTKQLLSVVPLYVVTRTLFIPKLFRV